MTNGRQIGASFERNVATQLKEHLGISFRRNLQQYQTKDLSDLISDFPFPFAIECKRRASGKTYSYDWWEQVSKSAKLLDKQPCLIYQLMRSPIKVVLDMDCIIETFGGNALGKEHLVEMSLESFCMIARELM
jgi:Holliday junction resolvase